MEKALAAEIEDVLEVFARNPEPLFSMSERLDNGEEMTEEDLQALNVCVNFTIGILAGYIQEIEGDESC